MGPGIVGTNSRLGFTGIEVGTILDAATGLGGYAIACLRASFADERDRHRGVSHHTLTALTIGTRSRVLIPIPEVDADVVRQLRSELAEAGIEARHEVVTLPIPDVLDLFVAHGLQVGSMGRPAEADPVLFQCAAAAGAAAVINMAMGMP
jgi:Protein of unknown function (DUF3866)